MLGELWTCRAFLLQGTPDSLEGVQGFCCRIGGLSQKAALYFCYEGRSVLLRMERAFCVFINYYNPARSWHLELEVCVVWYHIESSKCGSSQQCVIAAVEGDNIEDQLFASKVIRRSEDYLQCD